MRFFSSQKDKFSIPKKIGLGCLPVDRTVDRGRGRSTGRPTCMQPGLVGRSTVQRVLLSGNGPGRPAGRPAESCCSLYPAPVDRPESRCSLFPGPVDRAVDRWLNGHKNDHWLVDRAGISAISWLPTGRFLRGYKYPSLELVSSKFLEGIFFHLYKCLTACF